MTRRYAWCAALLAVSCATNPIALDLTRLDRCWAGARGAHMRWRVEDGSPGVHRGELRTPDGIERYTLTDGEGGFTFCRREYFECQPAMLGGGGAPEGFPEWVQVQPGADRLSIVRHSGAASSILFDGVPENCD